MNTITAKNLATTRAALTALETALDAMTALTDKGHFDYALIHDMTARRDALRWRIVEVLADAGDEAAQTRLSFGW